MTLALVLALLMALAFVFSGFGFASTFVFATLSVAAFVLTALGMTSTFMLTSLGFASALVLTSFSLTGTFMLARLSFTGAFVLAALGVTSAFMLGRFSFATTLGFASAAGRQFGASLGIGLHIVGIIAELADTIADSLGGRLFGIIGDRQLGSGHIIGTSLHSFKGRNGSLHHLGTATALAVGLDSYILRGLCGQSHSGHHDQHQKHDFLHSVILYF